MPITYCIIFALRRPLLRLIVQQALSLVLRSISFESWCQGPEHITSSLNTSLQGCVACARGQHWCSTAVQPWFRLLRKQLCGRCEKEGPVDLFAWMLYLSSSHALGPRLSHFAAMLVPGNVPFWPRSSAMDWTSWLDLRSFSWLWTCLVIIVTDLAAIAGSDPDPAVLTWLLAWPQTVFITMGLSGYLDFWLNVAAVSRPTQLTMPWVLWDSTTFSWGYFPFPPCFHTWHLPCLLFWSSMTLLVTGSWWFFSFHFLLCKSLEKVGILVLVLHNRFWYLSN